MASLTLTGVELSRLTKVFAVTTLVLTAGISLFRWGLLDHPLGQAVLQSVFLAITLTGLLFAGFYKFGWRLGPLASWMGRPDLRGVWLGHLASSYFKDGQPIPIVFVIRQTYLDISICSYTEKQRGQSTFEALIQNDRHAITVLAYIYELQRHYAGAQERVKGTGEVELLGGDRLRGFYWTNSPTHGSICLQRKSTQCEGIHEFEDAVQKWPISDWPISGF
ncbi:hypothetical protein FNZ56_04200 [Pseudoluteimonas lycopersici]|uniref:CD-NTase-associated protein 15 domain-containing protein n=1 Tax=Pseudoluteimonas lycopersici TaxID=1324796 RepID=A0A516V3M1_9GAMM|nr:hypothetical protein [Lysobacter lycopersici]QDQ73132.1 hypothetical protein FNZ56_04200 [Lysobacter lycopersici]